MASGVRVSDEVMELFKKMRVHHSGDDYQEHSKFVVLKIDDGKIIVDEEHNLKVKDLKGDDNVYKTLTSHLPKKQCCYALYDCCYETKETAKDDLVFIMWAPQDAPIKQRMVYASSYTAFKKALPGIKHEWQINDDSDICDEHCLLEKLGPKGMVRVLEGKELFGIHHHDHDH
ncbi:non-muscle cofilin 1-like [Centroberyx gerrardi]|uniref:non-muscle cofilin 1-like n=1 Tax=Centroberyx gerrardi TaxID=166262 RepID=UPI003AAEBBF6